MCRSHVISHEARAVLARESRVLGNAGFPSALAIASHIAEAPENPGGGTPTPLMATVAGLR